MRSLQPAITLALGVLMIGSTMATESTPRIEHRKICRQGWTLHVDSRLLNGSQKWLGDRAVDLLVGKLLQISVSLPAARLSQLRCVPIFLDYDHPLRVAQYHSSKRWLQQNGYDDSMSGAIHIPNARRFIALLESDRQPWVVMHELAHAYHDRFLGFDDKRVLSAHKRLHKNSGFKSVLHRSGKRLPPYAAVDHKEFFAEMTEAYLGRNDFYPFDRAELRAFDAVTFQLLSQIWSATDKDIRPRATTELIPRGK